MKKQRLNSELISNAFSFYNKHLGAIFSDNEADNLSKKLLDTVEYDYINKNEKLPYHIPQNTLYLIYFIGEYKRAYKHSNNKDKSKKYLESLGKGNTKRRKEFEKGLVHINDEELDMSIRYEYYFRNLLLLLLKKPSYKKVSLLLLGIFYTQFNFIKPLISKTLADAEALKALYSLQHALKFFEYTHLSDGKILNSSLIVIYTTLTKNLNIDRDTAYKHAKYLVNTFIDYNNNYLPTDRYRQSHITDKEIYYAGLYNGMPIFQWYINKNKKYFEKKDKDKLKVIFKLFIKGLKDDADLPIDISTNTTRTEKTIFESINNLTDDTQLNAIIDSVHITFVQFPFGLLQYFPQNLSK